MKRILLLCLALAGCNVTGLKGECSGDADCAAPSICLTTQSPHVCVLPQGQCFPACVQGQTCVNGACQVASTPVISMGSFDGRTIWMGPANTSVTVTATVTATGVAVKASSVTLTLSNGKSYVGTAGASNQFSFTVPMADLGSATSVTFKIDASDQLGNFAPSLSGLPTQILQIDNVAPSLGIAADTSWHGTTGTVVISGTATDAQSGVGSVTVTSTSAGGLTQAGTLSGGNFSVSVNLATLTFPAGFEGPWPFTVALTDKAGNQTTKSGSLNIDNKAPTVAAPAIVTPDDSNGTGWYNAAAGSISITAVISDGGSGVQSSGSTPCLTVPGDATCYAGTLTSGDASSGTYTFSLPRSAGTGKNGAVTYTISALDVAGHTNTNTGQIKFDDVKPSVTIAPDATWYARTSGTIFVNATISDTGSGLVATPPTITVGANPPLPGIFNSPNWVFALDTTQAPAGAEGPLSFTITAQDNVGNVASVIGSRNVDDKAPVVTIAADSTWYARTLALGGANIIVVNATITDNGSGLDTSNANKPVLKVGGTTVPGTFNSPNWQFNLDAAQAATNVEGALSFSITAQDNVGNITVATANGSRNVDDKAPSILHVKVYLSGTATPVADGVTAPASGSFLYTDSVAVYGEITDAGAGLSVSVSQPIPSFQINGIALGGGSASGPNVAIMGCTAGQQTKCTFLMSGVSLHSLPFFAGSGNMTLTVSADDLALGGDGSAQRHHAVTSALPIPVTRVKWSTAISALTSVSGLAIHPNGDVIVTGAGASATANTDTVFGLLPDGTISWHQGTNFYGAGANNEIGQIDGAPSIGAAATNPPVYVATLRKDFIGLSATDGSNIWHCGTGQLNGVPHQPPTIVQATTGCEALIVGDGDGTNHHINAACMNTSTTCTKSITTNVNSGCGCHATSPAVNLGGTLYLGFNFANVGGGNDNGVTSAVFGPAVAFGTVTRFAPTGYNTITNLSTDGTQIYGIDGAASQAYGMTAALASVWNVATSAAVNGAAAIEPSSGGLIVNTNDKKLHSLKQADVPAGTGGTDTLLQTFGTGNGNTPLLGSNGYMYFGNDLGAMLAVQDPGLAGYATAWSYSPGATPITVAPNMDCSGILYFAVGNTVYALITDSAGLRDSPWPKFQRDSRNSGNGSAATKWGMRTASGCTQ